MGITIEIDTESNLDLVKIENDTKYIPTSVLKEVVGSIKKIETTIQKVIDASEFKVGDYIRFKRTNIVGRVASISDFGKYTVETNIGITHSNVDGFDIEKWTPEKGDFCIFWEVNKAKSIGGIFDRMHNSEFMDSRNINWEHCVPFINETHFKEVVGYAI